MSEFQNLTVIDRLFITLNNLNLTHLTNKIKIFAGSTLPSGYGWCDGGGDRPDLTELFIYSTTSTDSYNQYSSTGSNDYDNMPTHTHNITHSPNANAITDKGGWRNANHLSPTGGTYGNNTNWKGKWGKGFANNQAPHDSGSNAWSNEGSKAPKDAGVNRQHTHQLTNRDSTVTVAVNHQMSIKDTVSINSSTQQNTTVSPGTSSTEHFPPYILLGFIMKT